MNIIDGTLVRYDTSAGFIRIRLRNKQRGTSRFLISQNRFVRWLTEDGGNTSFYDRDMGNFLAARKDQQAVYFEIVWLSDYDGGRLTGYRDRFVLSVNQVNEMLFDGKGVFLYHQRQNCPKLDFSGAASAVKHMLADKQTRRAFQKGIPRAFRWYSAEVIRFYSDGGANFYFVEDRFTGQGISGGFICHREAKAKQPGQEARVYYSVHT